MFKLRFPLQSVVNLHTDYGTSYSGKVVKADENSVAIISQTLLANFNSYGFANQEIPANLLVPDKTMDVGTPIIIDRSRIVAWSYFTIPVTEEHTYYSGLPTKSEWESCPPGELNLYSDVDGFLICQGKGELIG